MKPKSKPIKSALRKRKGKRLVTKPARRRMKLAMIQICKQHNMKGAV